MFAGYEALKIILPKMNPYYRVSDRGKRKTWEGLDTEKRKYLRAFASEGESED